MYARARAKDIRRERARDLPILQILARMQRGTDGGFERGKGERGGERKNQGGCGEKRGYVPAELSHP